MRWDLGRSNTWTSRSLWNVRPSCFHFVLGYCVILGFPGGSDGNESACNAGDPGLMPGSEKFPGEGNGNLEILAWRIPWTEEPCGLQSMGSQREGLSAQSCPTLCDPTRLLCPWNFPVRILEWVSISFSRVSFKFRDWTYVFCVSCISRQILLPLPPRWWLINQNYFYSL